MSAGVYGWPKDDAIAAAVDTLRSTPTRSQEARLVAFDRATYDAIAAAAGWLRARPVFVLHDHRKPAPHFDLRLEEDGVLKSWAVPRGMPTDYRHDRLAVQVGDHDLDHATYTDEHKGIADTGWWELEDRTEKRFVFVLHGRDGRAPLRHDHHRPRRQRPPAAPGEEAA